MSHLSPPVLHRLDLACKPILDAFGHEPYLVGSVQERTASCGSDVDVRLILPDDEYDALMAGTGPGFPDHARPRSRRLRQQPGRAPRGLPGPAHDRSQPTPQGDRAEPARGPVTYSLGRGRATGGQVMSRAALWWRATTEELRLAGEFAERSWRFGFERRDLWVGLYWDQKADGQHFYLCPLPTLVFHGHRRPRRSADPALGTGRPEAES